MVLVLQCGGNSAPCGKNVFLTRHSNPESVPEPEPQMFGSESQTLLTVVVSERNDSYADDIITTCISNGNVSCLTVVLRFDLRGQC